MEHVGGMRLGQLPDNLRSCMTSPVRSLSSPHPAWRP